MAERLAAILIGRNEGDRLVRALAALAARGISTIVYVDSNSTDTSVEEAKKIGAEVIELDMSVPFTAARARNAGWKRALSLSTASVLQLAIAEFLAQGGYERLLRSLRTNSTPDSPGIIQSIIAKSTLSLPSNSRIMPY